MEILKKGEYQRKNGSYEYKYVDLDGKRRSVYAKDLASLREKEERVLNTLREFTEVGRDDLTLNDVRDMWLDFKSQEGKVLPATIDAYKKAYCFYAKDSIGRREIKNITRSDMTEYYDDLVAFQDGNLSALNKISNIFNQIFNYAVEKGILKENEISGASGIVAGKYRNKRESYYSQHEQVCLERFIKEHYPQWNGILTFFLYTGVTSGELSGLIWDDIDFEKETITIERSLNLPKKNQKGIASFETYGGAPKKRHIPMLPKVKAALLEEKRRQEEYGVVSTVEVEGISDFVFLTYLGSPYNSSLLNITFKRLIAKYNERCEENSMPFLFYINCKGLRNTFEKRMSETGISGAMARKILGCAPQRYVSLNILEGWELMNFTDFKKCFSDEGLDE